MKVIHLSLVLVYRRYFKNSKEHGRFSRRIFKSTKERKEVWKLPEVEELKKNKFKENCPKLLKKVKMLSG